MSPERRPSRAVEVLGNGVRWIELGGLYSLAPLHLGPFLQEEFDIVLDNEVLGLEDITTVGGVVRLVEAKADRGG
jgi:hypothetical protein